MKPQVLFLVIIVSYTASQGNKEVTQKFIIPEDPQQNYRKLCTTMVKMIENSKIASTRNLDVLIFSMIQDSLLPYFEGFHAMMNKVSSDIITTRSFTLSKVERNSNADFVILLIFNQMSGYKNLIQEHFDVIFPDTSIRMFVVALDTDDFEILLPVLTALAQSYFHNIYGILQKNAQVLDIFQIKMRRLQENLHMSEIKSKGDKFEMLSEILKPGDVKIIKIVHFNVYPLTYVKDGVVYGADGNLIREFCKKYGFNYRITNKGTEQSTLERMNVAMRKDVDILLTTNIYAVTNRMIGIWLNEMDGGCLLVPRNVPVSSIENLSLPFDSMSVAFMALSVALLIVFWKIIAIVNGKHMSAVNIMFDAYLLTFGMGISTLDRLTYKEKLMILCFMFGSFILATSYQSIILSFMLMNPAMRSAKDLQELNASDTKFYMFYDQNVTHNGDPLFIRRELIMNIRNFNESFELPRDLDHNLVYFVSCKYANIFVQTPRNYRDGKRLFDRMLFTPMLQRYSVKTEFYYKEELALIVSALTESGLYSFWNKEFINSVNQEEDRKHEYETMIEFHNMKVPFIILSSGYLIALHAFVIEILFNLFENRRLKMHQQLSLLNPIRLKRQLLMIRGKI
ncbi:hypothetical protein ACKWTF_006525 [Chironomus riparius]